MNSKFPQYVRFCVVGLMAFAFDFTMLWLLYGFLPKLVAVSIAYLSAVALHFCLNKWWVFRAGFLPTTGQVVRYLLSVMATWACTVSVVWLALLTLTANIFVAKAIAIVPTAVLGFLLLRFFVFADPSSLKAPVPDTNTNPIRAEDAVPCPLCRTITARVGWKRGHLIARDFIINRCDACHFVFVVNPWTEFDRIYDQAYYEGRGADPLVDYLFELEHPALTIRQFEWEGICEIVGQLLPLNSRTRWLDFGSGNGGLVRYCRDKIGCDAWGFEEGWIVGRAVQQGTPMCTRGQLASQHGSFDVITAIEVIEHTTAPLEFLTGLRPLLKPGGVLFLTTGNVAPFTRDICNWRYVVPEIHTSFFEPGTLQRALEQTGFRCEYRGFEHGWEKVIKFKLLKNLGFRRVTPWMRFIPWKSLARLYDARLKLTAHPVGCAD